MSRRRKQSKTSFAHLNEESARLILSHLGTANTARLRTASRATRDMGRAHGSCQSHEIHQGGWMRLRVDGVAVGVDGVERRWNALIYPTEQSVLFGTADSRIDIDLVANVRLTGTAGSIASVKFHTNSMRWRWFEPLHRSVKDQIVGCVAREVARNAAFVAQLYRQAADAMIMQNGPRTVAQVMASVGTMVPHE